MKDGTNRCEAHKARPGSFADSRRGSRHERGYGAEWDKIRKRVMVRDKGLCQPCAEQGRITVGTEVDHKINKAEWKRRYGTLDGVDDEENAQVICRDCHKAKTERESKQGRAG